MTTLTHLEFRRKFTLTEQELADELEATFEANPMLTTEQKRSLRTGYKNFYAATGVDLSDPAIPPMLGLYTALGIIGDGRAAEILAEPAAVAPAETPAFVATHTLTLGGVMLTACVDPDGTVRLSDGKWTTLDTLAATGVTLEII